MSLEDDLETLKQIGFEVAADTLMGGICLISDHKEAKMQRIGLGLITKYGMLELGACKAIYERRWEDMEVRTPVPVYRLIEVQNCTMDYVPRGTELIPVKKAA